MGQETRIYQAQHFTVGGVCFVVLDPEKGIIFLFGSSENSLTTHLPAPCERRPQSFGATPAANTRAKSRTVSLGEE